MRSSFTSRPRSYSELVLGERVMDSSTLLFSRAIISGVAIILLWSTSLSLITNVLQITDAFPIPEVDVVIDKTIRLINESKRLRTNYINCVTSELQVCNATLNGRVEREAKRAEDARAHNQEMRASSRQASVECATAQANGLSSVRAWQSAQTATVSTSAHYSRRCTAAEKTELSQMTGDTSAHRSASMQLVQEYSDTSQKTTRSLGGQVVDRARYDRVYLYNKTLRNVQISTDLSLNYSLRISDLLGGINMTDVLNCATLLPGGSCPDGEGARQMVVRGQARLADQYDSAKSTYDSTARATAVYVDEVEAKLENAAETFSTIVSTLNDAFSELEGPNAGFRVYFPNLQLPNVGLPFRVPFPPIGGLDFSGVPSVDDIAAATSRTVQRYQDSVDYAVGNSNRDMDRLSLDLNYSFQLPGCGGWPCDYNPPDIDGAHAQQKVKEHEEASEIFEQDAAVSLDAFDEARDADSNQSDSSSRFFAGNISASKLIESARNTNWFSYKALDDGNIIVQWWLDRITAIFAITQTLDIVWRVLQTLSIVRRFWTRSALTVEPIDMTTDGESKTRTGRVLSPIQGTAMVATHPLVLLCVMMGFFMVLATLGYQLYTIPFDAYVDSCTRKDLQGRPVGDGTFLTRNAYAIAFNYASHDGNRLRLEGLDSYHLARSDACARYGERSASQESEVYADMDLIVNSHVRTQSQVRLMRRCYNTSFLDRSFVMTPVLNPDGLPYPLVSASVSETACDTELTNSSLQNGVFDCTKLPECDLSCDDLADKNGDDTSELILYARAAMCTAQWWVHALVLRTLFSMVIWLFLNIFRIVFIAGLVRVCWNWLNTGHFAYLATCLADGTHTYNEDDLAERVAVMLGRMRLTGLCLVAFACASQVPWIYAIQHFVKDLAYNRLT